AFGPRLEVGRAIEDPQRWRAQAARELFGRNQPSRLRHVALPWVPESLAVAPSGAKRSRGAFSQRARLAVLKRGPSTRACGPPSGRRKIRWSSAAAAGGRPERPGGAGAGEGGGAKRRAGGGEVGGAGPTLGR